MADLAQLKADYPQYDIVSAIDAPGGGTWALGRDGGVFSLNGAPFFGNYFTIGPQLEPPGGRRFKAIRPNGSGGYELVSENDEVYGSGGEFGPPRPTETTTTSPAGDPIDSVTNPSPEHMRDILRAILAPIGMADLTDVLLPSIAADDPESLIVEKVRQSPQYKVKFPGIVAMRDKGLGPPSEADYLASVRGFGVVNSAYAINANTFGSAEFMGRLIANGVSPAEWSSRVQNAAIAASNVDPDTVAALKAYWVTDGDLTSFWLNPDAQTDEIMRKAQVAQIGGAATRTGFGALDRTEAEGLQALGLSPGEAANRLGAAAALNPLTDELLGETQDLGRSDLLDVVRGDVNAETRLQRRAAQRRATFEGGGGAAGVGRPGTSGLGSSQS